MLEYRTNVAYRRICRTAITDDTLDRGDSILYVRCWGVQPPETCLRVSRATTTKADSIRARSMRISQTQVTLAKSERDRTQLAKFTFRNFTVADVERDADAQRRKSFPAASALDNSHDTNSRSSGCVNSIHFPFCISSSDAPVNSRAF